MARESTTIESESEMLAAFEQLRSGLSFLPLIIGLTRPLLGSGPDRVVLVNPGTQGMIVLDGDATMITAMLGGGGGSGGGGSPPASKTSIESMRLVDSAELQGTEEEECSVCLDALKEEEMVKEMPCRHHFHGRCIEKWLKMHGSCPVCRFQMPKEEGAGLKKEGEGNGERRRGREIWFTVAVTRNNDNNNSASDEQEEEEEYAGDDQSQGQR